MADLIDRDALEAKIRENSITNRFFDPSVNVIMHLIRYAPAVNRWIPCSERMPEVETRVLLAHENRDIMIGELCDIKIFDTDNGFVKLEDITHWMPLPEPPEKE